MTDEVRAKASFTDHSERGHVTYTTGQDEDARNAIETGSTVRSVARTARVAPRFPNRKPSTGPRNLGR